MDLARRRREGIADSADLLAAKSMLSLQCLPAVRRSKVNGYQQSVVSCIFSFPQAAEYRPEFLLSLFVEVGRHRVSSTSASSSCVQWGSANFVESRDLRVEINFAPHFESNLLFEREADSEPHCFNIPCLGEFLRLTHTLTFHALRRRYKDLVGT